MATKKINTDLKLEAKLLDASGSAGTNGQILSSTGTVTDWISLSELQGVDGSGTANYLPVWTDSDTLGDSIIYSTSSNVGIGTTSPSQKFHVNSGATNHVAKFESTDSIAEITIHDNSTYTRLLNISTDFKLMPNNGGTEFIFEGDTGNFVNPGHIRLVDNGKVQFGASQDLEIYHDGTDSFISNTTGGLYIQNLDDDGDIVLRGNDGTGGVTQYLKVDSSAQQIRVYKNVRHEDNIKSMYGTGSDLQIYHDGSNSYVRDVGTGRLWIDSNGEGVSIISDGLSSTPMANFYKDGAVELYYNNNKRFETTDSGTTITSTGTGDSLLITNEDATSDAAPVITLKRDSSTPADGDYLGQLKFKGESDTGVERVYAKITAKTSDVSNEAEDGLIETAVRSNGSNLIVSRQTHEALKLINGTGLEVDGDTNLSGNLTIDGGIVVADPDAAGRAFAWKESDSSTVAGELRSYGNRGDIYLYKDGTKLTELSPGTDSFIPALHIGGTAAASGGVLEVTGDSVLTGHVDIGSNTNGKNLNVYGNATGEGMFWDASESHLTIKHDDGDLGLEIYSVNAVSPTTPQLRIGRSANQYWGVYTSDRDTHLVHQQDETDGEMRTNFEMWDNNTTDKNGYWRWRSGDVDGNSMFTALKLTQAGDATFTGSVKLIEGEKVVFDSDSDSYSNISFDNTSGNLIYEAAGQHHFKNGEDDSYESVKAGDFIKDGGTSSQFLKADGSVDSNTYLTSSDVSSYYVNTGSDQTVGGTKLFSNNLGVGTLSPTSGILSTRILKVSSAGNSEVNVDHTDGGTGSDIGLFSFSRNGDHLAHMKATHDGSTTSAFLSFHTQASGGSYTNAGSNERMRITSSGDVGIGKTTPGYKLDIVGGANNGLRVGESENSNSWNRLGILSYVSESQANALGDYSFIYTTNPSSYTEDAFSKYGGLVIQGRDNGNSSFAIRLGDGNGHDTRMFMGATGVTTFSNTVTAQNFILSSDSRLKDNVEDVDNSQVDVNWKTFEMKSNEGQKRYGVIAQELEEKHPEFVRTDDKGMKSVAYVDLLIAKIAELEARLEKLEK